MRKRKVAEGKTAMTDAARLTTVLALREQGLLFREIGHRHSVSGKYASYLHSLAILRRKASP